jgi:hypothetical protein
MSGRGLSRKQTARNPIPIVTERKDHRGWTVYDLTCESCPVNIQGCVTKEAAMAFKQTHKCSALSFSVWGGIPH